MDARNEPPRRSGLWAAAAIVVLGSAGAIMLSTELGRRPEAAAAPEQAPADAGLPIDAPPPIDTGLPIDGAPPSLDAEPPEPKQQKSR